MAKLVAGHFTVLLKVLDLYELYNLVVARGGLVEVINKKQWQEIIKGLGLPSSITSAAFTLRTQYTKYLYPLECKTVNLSNPSDLQSAIEGNKREGRTSSYGPYGGMGHLPFQVCPHHSRQSFHLDLLQNSPLPPSLGGMPPFSMMNNPPRPLHMNGSRPSLHPGISKGISKGDAALVDWVTRTNPPTHHTRVSNNINPSHIFPCSILSLALKK